MVDWRRQLHRRPELSFAEHDTTALIRDHMASLDIEEAARTTETGGIFAMEGGRPGRSVVLRADIDALPVHEDEATAVPLRGRGRDARLRPRRARGLPARRGPGPGARPRGPAGPLRLPLPAGRGGAVRRQGHGRGGCARPPWRAHAWSASTSRRRCRRASWRCGAGIAMSEANSLRITLTGPGGHGAMPSAKGDVIRATAELVSRLGDGGLRPALRGGRLRVQRRHDPRRDRGQRRPHVGPRHGHAAHVHRDPARARPSAASSACATEWATTRASHIELELPEHTPAVVNDPGATDAGRGGGGGRGGPRPGVPHATGRHPATT